MPVVEQPSLEVQQQYWNNKWEWTKNQYPHPGARRRGDTILRYLRSLGLEKPSILDFGCGTGWLSAMLAEVGPTTGIDLSEAAIEMAKATYPGVAFVAGNLFEMPLAEKKFDLVVSQEVIAHVPDQVGYLELVCRVLRPRGYLIITTANKFVNDRTSWPSQPPGHIEQWLTMNALKRLLRPQFEVLRTTTVNPLGDGGVLRFVNSYKLNAVANSLFGEKRVQEFKEKIGLGWTLVTLARKRS